MARFRAQDSRGTEILTQIRDVLVEYPIAALEIED
jgi:hypothetical protein